MTRGEYAQCDRIQMAELAVTVLCFHAGDTWNGWSGGDAWNGWSGGDAWNGWSGGDAWNGWSGGETGTSNVEQTHRVWLGSGM